MLSWSDSIRPSIKAPWALCSEWILGSSPRRTNISTYAFLATTLHACSLAPNLKMPDMNVPASYKEQPTAAAVMEVKGDWKPAYSLEKADRGEWWKIFDDEQLDELEAEAALANQSLKAAAARVEQARFQARANIPSFLPDLNIGGNAVRAQPSSAGVAAFGGPAGVQLKPYTLYSAQAVASYEADIFGRVRDNYDALLADTDAQAAAYRHTLLALQADVAQNYFALRALDVERNLLRETIKIREEANRIMQRRFDVGESAAQDISRTQTELASVKADLLALDRQRAVLEHGLAVLLGKMPSQFMIAESPLADMPPEIPAGLPSSLLERRPDIATAQATMAAANARIGVARTAFFPRLLLTASGGYESTQLSNLFLWSNRTWALGQLANVALSMPIFDNGRNLARLDQADAAYNEAIANYRQQVLVAFRDVEDNLAAQSILAAQIQQLEIAANAAGKTMELTQRRYKEGDIDYFEIVNAERDALNARRSAVQARGQRFIITVSLIRALGGAWGKTVSSAPASTPTPLLANDKKDAAPTGAAKSQTMKQEKIN